MFSLLISRRIERGIIKVATAVNARRMFRLRGLSFHSANRNFCFLSCSQARDHFQSVFNNDTSPTNNSHKSWIFHSWFMTSLSIRTSFPHIAKTQRSQRVSTNPRQRFSLLWYSFSVQVECHLNKYQNDLYEQKHHSKVFMSLDEENLWPQI